MNGGETTHIIHRAPDLVQYDLDYVRGMFKLQIDLYWKRASYFWTIQAAAFVVFFGLTDGGVMHKTVVMALHVYQSAPAQIGASFPGEIEVISLHRTAMVVIASIGVLTSFAAVLIAAGSKHAIDCWKDQIMIHEGLLDSDVTRRVFSEHSEKHYDTASVNLLLIKLFCFGWLVLLVFCTFRAFYVLINDKTEQWYKQILHYPSNPLGLAGPAVMGVFMCAVVIAAFGYMFTAKRSQG